MTKHDRHSHCKHDLAFCDHCDTVWCKTCSRAWGNSVCMLPHYYFSSPITPQPFVPTYPTYPTYPILTWTHTTSANNNAAPDALHGLTLGPNDPLAKVWDNPEDAAAYDEPHVHVAQ